MAVGKLERLRARQEVVFFGALHRAAPRLTEAWWTLLVARGVLPVGIAIASGWLVATVQDGASTTPPLVVLGATFVAYQVAAPVHQAVGGNLGARAAGWLNERLLAATTTPPGIAHLESPALAADLTTAREFDEGLTAPPLFVSMDFIASGLVQLVVGAASAVALAGFAWWAPLVLLAAWLSTHRLLRESAVWRDRNTDEVRTARRHADYAFRLAVDPPAAKELRLFGLADWVIDRFAERRRHLYELERHATRLRERPLILCTAIVVGANGLVFAALARAASDGSIGLDALAVYGQTAVGTSAIAFGGLSWALDSAAAAVAAALRLERSMAPVGALADGGRPAADRPRAEIRFRDVRFRYPAADDADADASPEVLRGLDLAIPAGTSLAIVGVNGAGKTTLAKLLCRLYDPTGGRIEVDGTDLRELDLVAWRRRLAAVFQDYVRYELPLRDNVAPFAPRTAAMAASIAAALHEAGGDGLADLDTVLSPAYAGGIDLSGGQWQRVALARALCAVSLGAGVVLLDEPTAQLDVRGEAEIFRRILDATRGATTILISHRFSTVRLADRICVLEGGRVVELASHDELMARGGRYRELFDLQASRFAEVDDEGAEVVHDTLA